MALPMKRKVLPAANVSPRSAGEFERALTYNNMQAAKRALMLPPANTFDAEGPDFPETLLPMALTRGYIALPLSVKRDILTGALLVNLQDTFQLETGLLQKATKAALKLDLPLRIKAFALQHGAIEELQHALQSANQIEITRHHRHYVGALPTGSFVRSTKARLTSTRGLRRGLAALVRTGALEIDQTYLHVMAQSVGTNRFQAQYAAVHYEEERTHQAFWFELLVAAFKGLGRAGRAILLEELVGAAWDVTEYDSALWLAVLTNAGVDETTAEQIVEQARPQPTPSAGIVQLVEALGLPKDHLYEARRAMSKAR